MATPLHSFHGPRVLKVQDSIGTGTNRFRFYCKVGVGVVVDLGILELESVGPQCIGLVLQGQAE